MGVCVCVCVCVYNFSQLGGENMSEEKILKYIKERLR